tara:strand:- start:1877 stop:2566 length:690 start_codon:yes stop_codon:yes gene_type:complete
MKVSLIIPCFNENKNLQFLFVKLKKILENNLFEVIIVDNGSKDKSLSTIKKYKLKYENLKYIKLKENEGYGNGILSGLNIATGDFMAWTHADMQCDPQDILKGINLIKKGKNNIFIKGIRHGRNINDRFFTFGMSIFCSLILGTFLWDINAQPTIFHKSLFNKWKNPPKDFSLDLYAYYQAKKLNYKIKRIPVKFSKRLHGISNWNTDFNSKFKFIKRTISFTIKLPNQ